MSKNNAQQSGYSILGHLHTHRAPMNVHTSQQAVPRTPEQSRRMLLDILDQAIAMVDETRAEEFAEDEEQRRSH
jgi:hypothetical protein